MLHVFLIGPLPTTLSQFEVGSSSTTVLDPVSEATAFFTCFDQPEDNDLDPVDFWGSGPLYVEILRIVLLFWRRSTVVVVTSCKDFALAVLPKCTF